LRLPGMDKLSVNGMRMVETSCVQVADNRRRLGDLDELERSIRTVGLLSPITVTESLRLVAGNHRLTVCRDRLKWKTIPAVVLSLDAIDAELAEIDENLVRNELTALEYAEQLARRKELYLARHPETKHGGAPGRPGGGKEAKEDKVSSFAEDTSRKAGVAPRTVRRDVKIARDIEAGVRESIRATKLADSKTELIRLARLAPDRQRDAVARIASGEAKNVRHAARLGKIPPVLPLPPGTTEDLSGLIRSGQRFGCIYADPPWSYGNQATRASTGNHYETMSVAAIAAVPVKDLAAEDAHLHLWTTNAFLFECPRILEAWGFTYKSVFVWCKPQMGIGNYWRVSHEFLVLGVRGDPDFSDRGLMSWAAIDRGTHSSKPEQVRLMIEKASPPPYLELFGRRAAQGWTVWGDEIERDLFNQGEKAS
jgi:N6-adenosine-specific RNA methylase IME4